MLFCSKVFDVPYLTESLYLTREPPYKSYTNKLQENYSFSTGGFCISSLVSGFVVATPMCSGRIEDRVDFCWPPIDAET